MADLHGHARERGVEEQDDKVVSATFDEPVTDPESDLAVQVPEGVDGSDANPLGVHSEPTPEEAFKSETKSSRKSSSKSDDSKTS